MLTNSEPNSVADLTNAQGDMVTKNSPRERRESFVEVLRRKKLDAAIISDPKHVFYFTGYSTFWLRQVALLLLKANADSQLFIGEQRAADARKAYDGEVSTFEDYDLKERMIAYPGYVAKQLSKFLIRSKILRNCGRIGLEDWHMPHIYVDAVSRAAPKARFNSITELILSERKTKGKDEVSYLREAAKRMELAYQTAAANIRAGKTEIELCRDVMSDSILKHGPFEFSRGDTWISGERTLEVGGPPSSRSLANGDSVILDLQAVYKNYWADGARTFVVGEVNEDQERLFNVILAAKKRGEELLKSGVLCKDIYSAVAKEIEDAGYGRMFPHHAGHGLGLEDQEGPFFIPGSKERLERGVICTIEPGIYHPKTGGFRDEDIYIITEEGYEKITTSAPYSALSA